MIYTCDYLKFGSQVHVPDHPPIKTSNNIAPIPKILAEGSGPGGPENWDLQFTFVEPSSLFRAAETVPGKDDVTIRSWYAKRGDPCPAPHTLVFSPFIIEENGAGAFAQASDFVAFSEPPPNGSTGSAINTDTLIGADVTATVQESLPGYEKISVSGHGDKHSLILSRELEGAFFDSIFVYFGDAVPAGKVITVKKGESGCALAIFKKTRGVIKTVIDLHQWPQMSPGELPVTIWRIIRESMLNARGEVYEHLSPRTIAALDHETLEVAGTVIDRRVDELRRIKAIIADLGGKPAK